MKPERIDLQGVSSVGDLIARILQTRLREARSLAPGLDGEDKQSLHDFRIACKRLRYALERFEALEPPFAKAADCLARLQDALGEAHDRDVLLTILPPSMATTERTLKNERQACVDRAGTLWLELQQIMQTLDSHRI